MRLIHFWDKLVAAGIAVHTGILSELTCYCQLVDRLIYCIIEKFVLA